MFAMVWIGERRMGREKKILKSELSFIIEILSLLLRTLMESRFFSEKLTSVEFQQWQVLILKFF